MVMANNLVQALRKRDLYKDKRTYLNYKAKIFGLFLYLMLVCGQLNDN